jgi:hypothetical protein
MQLSQLLKIKQEEIKESISILDSEELVNKAYEGLLTVLSLYPEGKGLECYSLNHEQGIDGDIFTPLITGLYIPGSKRLYWAGHVDVSVDLIMERGSVYLEPPDDCDYSFVSVVEMDKFPKHIYNGDPSSRHLFKVITVYFYKKQFQKEKGKVGKTTCYFSISQDGSIYQAVDTHFIARIFREQYETGPGAISLLADRLYIWNIETREPNTSFGFPAMVTFGIEMEMVKSLVYARSLPLTESGRKRPILHWVRAHQRRMKDGIEIDIEKFLRGVTGFNMGGLEFGITRPIKTPKKPQFSIPA